jgi:hypothetical protein
MAQDNERHFVSLLGVFLALTSGGAAGNEFLRLRVRISESLKILTTIFVPVATSLVYAFLGLKQGS